MIYKFRCDCCGITVTARAKPGHRRRRCKTCALKVKWSRFNTHKERETCL